MKTTRGKLRNITTGILHTSIGDVYEFFEKYLDADGIMTHQIPSAYQALGPFLKSKLSDEWFTKKWRRKSSNSGNLTVSMLRTYGIQLKTKQ